MYQEMDIRHTLSQALNRRDPGDFGCRGTPPLQDAREIYKKLFSKNLKKKISCDPENNSFSPFPK